MKAVVAIAAVVAGSSVLGGELPECALSVYHLTEGGAVGSEPFIRPANVTKVEPFKDVVAEAFPELALWLVTLTPEGAEINRSYTSRNVGGKVAVYCDGREVSRPTIRSVLRDQFVFGVLKEGK